MVAQRKLFTQILCRFIFVKFMITNKEKIFRFLFSIVPQRVYKGIYLCYSDNIGVLFRTPSKKEWKNLPVDSIWITPSRRIFRKLHSSFYHVYLLEKQEEGYCLIDVRSLRIGKDLYKLPGVEVALKRVEKTELIQALEKEHFAFFKKGNFHLKNDSLFRLQNPEYATALDIRKKTPLLKRKITEVFFRFCLAKLDR